MNEYLAAIAQKFARTDVSSGREMIYRADLELLLKQIFKADKVTEINHDSTNDKGNKPDFVISKNSVPILYLEAKDLGTDLDKIEKSEQMARYFGYENLVLTDYVEFRFYRNGEKYGEPIAIASINKAGRTICPQESNFDFLTKTLVDFTTSHAEPIKSGAHLAKIMGGKAQRIRDNILEMQQMDTEKYEPIKKIEAVIKSTLLSSLTDEKFADMYAQTLVYGLFAARYNDPSLETFSRAEARDLISKTNPFLRSFFDHIAGESFPDRLGYIVDELCEVFTHADIIKLLSNFYKRGSKDPVIHFYEDFLREYDAKKKMEMGVFYTPQPVVNFIVRAVDDLLKTEFGISEGLSDTRKIEQDGKIFNAKGKLINAKVEYHKVQILDVATGTGTFLNEVVDLIHKGFANQQGRWPAYVRDNLLPRLHGFELMIASYTIAHLKLGMKLNETGAEEIKQRLGIYLTNTLDEAVEYGHQQELFGFMDSIAQESKDASRIKSEYPIMCVIGNPPYSGVSQNKDYKENNVYKVEPGGKEKLKEKKHWLDDDYVKFIRFSESLIEKNGEGVLGMITAHGYIDNPTFRGMRWHLRKTFDKIYVIDLHGNSNKKETTLSGGKDENVFDIKTGVSIILGIKTGEKKKTELGQIFKADIWGTRAEKMEQLNNASVSNIDWQIIPQDSDLWIIEGEGKSDYMKGFSISEIFEKSTTGIVTGIDRLSIFKTKQEAIDTTQKILNSTDPYTEFSIKDGRKVKKETRLKELRDAFEENTITQIFYRPFDIRWIFYTKGSEVWINSPRSDVMQNLIDKDNIAITTNRQVKFGNDWQHISVINKIAESSFISNKTSEICSVFPLYTFEENGKKSLNLKPEIISQISSDIGEEIQPIDVLNYLYAYLHSTNYRTKYYEFLKQDFPRIPYPKSKLQFQELAALGSKLIDLHLSQSSGSNQLNTTYSIPGSDVVENIKYELGDVYINENQKFGNVPEKVWNFYIGSYQPAQKWLKDRKGEKLQDEDLNHYQKIIKTIADTIEIMAEIDAIITNN